MNKGDIIDFQDYLFELGVEKSKLIQEKWNFGYTNEEWYEIHYKILDDGELYIAENPNEGGKATLKQYLPDKIVDAFSEEYFFPVRSIFPKNSKNLYLIYGDEGTGCYSTKLNPNKAIYNLAHAQMEIEEYKVKTYGSIEKFEEYANDFTTTDKYGNHVFHDDELENEEYKIYKKYSFFYTALDEKILKKGWGKIHVDPKLKIGQTPYFIWEHKKVNYILNFYNYFSSTKNKIKVKIM